MIRLSRIGVVAALAVFSAAGVAQTAAVSEADAAKAIEARRALFKEIGDLNGPIGAMLRRQRPMDTAVVATNMAKIKDLAAKIPEVYTVDTRQHKGIETEALDGIWASQADFKTKADALVKVAGDVVDIAKTGDAAATQRALANVGRTCGGCHDAYRLKK